MRDEGSTLETHTHSGKGAGRFETQEGKLNLRRWLASLEQTRHPQSKCAALEGERAPLHPSEHHRCHFSVFCGASDAFASETIDVPAPCPNECTSAVGCSRDTWMFSN